MIIVLDLMLQIIAMRKPFLHVIKFEKQEFLIYNDESFRYR